MKEADGLVTEALERGSFWARQSGRQRAIEKRGMDERKCERVSISSQ
jgi:hypothetical protein